MRPRASGLMRGRASAGASAISFITRMSLAVYLVEAGIILAVAPWTAWWQRNYFADLWPWVGMLMAGAGARWGVVIVGVLTAVAGMSDLRDALVRRLTQARSTEPPASSPLS